MASIKKKLSLKHQSNLGDEVEEVSFDEGEEITILKEWADRYLCKNASGQLFNVPKDWVEAD